MKLRQCILKLILLTGGVFAREAIPFPGNADATTIRVGIYQNSPKIFTDDSGNPSGIFVDILKQIAQDNGWALEFVPGEWYENLQRLESGDIDLMPDVAYSDARAQQFDFNKITVLNNWAQIYTTTLSDIESVADLAGKTIVAMRDDYSYDEFKHTLVAFGIKCRFLEVDSFEEVFLALDDRRAEAGIISRFFGLSDHKEHDVRLTTIMCCPARLHFAVTKGDPKNLLVHIDASVKQMRDLDSSAYYLAIEKWLGQSAEWHLPIWMRHLSTFLLALFIALILAALLLRMQVKRITKKLESAQELVIQNQRLSALGEMASGIVHDFRNELSPILGSCDLLLMHKDKWTDLTFIEENLNRIKSAASDSEQIVTRLQQFYRPVEQTEKLDAVDLDQVISESIDLSKHRLDATHTVKVVHNLNARALISGNQAELRQAIMNLIFNAYDAMPDGGSLILQTENRGDQVLFTVEDTGIGMSDEVRKRALEPFFSTKGEDGTGMGLAMVYGTIRRHFGKIEIESILGKGTVISIRFPLLQVTQSV